MDELSDDRRIVGEYGWQNMMYESESNNIVVGMICLLFVVMDVHVFLIYLNNENELSPLIVCVSS